MQFKISGQKTDGMSAGREKIDDGEKDLAVGPAMFFLGKNWRECRGCFGSCFSDGTGYQAATLHASM